MLSAEQLETLYDENKASLKSLLDSRMPGDYNARLARSHERSRLIRENCTIAEELQRLSRVGRTQSSCGMRYHSAGCDCEGAGGDR